MHRDFAVMLYKKFFTLTREEVLEIVQSAVDVEQAWVRSALPKKNQVLKRGTHVCEYVEYVADHLLRALGFVNHYNSTCPFDFMGPDQSLWQDQLF